VIVRDLDVLSAAFGPAEAHAPLVVYPDAVLSGAISFERFEPIARGHPKVVQACRQLELPKFAARNRLDIGKSPNPFAGVERLRLPAPEGLDHNKDINASRY
jgi:hypothetical protein